MGDTQRTLNGLLLEIQNTKNFVDETIDRNNTQLAEKLEGK